MLGRLAVLVLLAGLVGAPAAQARTQETRVIKVVSISLEVVVNDTAPKQVINKGDMIGQRSKLLNPEAQFGMAKGVRVGSDRGVTTYTGPKSARFDGITNLPGGTLVLHGPITMRKGGVTAIRVAGGTGKFKGARGVLLIAPGNPKTPGRVLNTYRLTLPTLAA
jgi:hypothetical protein